MPNRVLRFYVCLGMGMPKHCGFVKTALGYERSRVGDYCPRCQCNQYWRGPLSTRTHTLSGHPLKAKR